MTDASTSIPDPDDDIPTEDTAATRLPGLQPETQGDEPIETEIGDEGQGDLGEGDLQQHSGDAPDDLRTSAPAPDAHDGGHR